MNFQKRVLSLLALVALVAICGARAQQNQVKGQGQLVGANGEFGVTYSLKTGFNFTLLSAKYSIEPFDCYGAVSAQTVMAPSLACSAMASPRRAAVSPARGSPV